MAGADDGLIAVNGEVTPAADARIPALDRGFLFGDAVFETLVAFHGRILNTPEHLARLRRSAETLRMEIPFSDAELGFELVALAEQLARPKASLRLVVTRGQGLGLRPRPGMRPNKIVYCTPAAAEPRATYEQGFALKRLVRTTTERGAAPKTGNYAKSVAGIDRAQHEGFDDILWTNADGELTESSVANVFFVARQGDAVEIVTPPPASGILLGITRQTVLDLFKRAGIAAHEQVIFADELPRFDEAFLTSTVRGLVPVARVDQKRFFTTRPGAVFHQVTRLFSAWVESELGFKVDWATGTKLAGTAR